MRRRQQPRQFIAWIMLAIFVAGALLQLHVARDTGLAWLLLDRELRVLPESAIPPEAPLHAGDRIVAVNAVEVRTPAGLALILDANRGERSVTIRVQREGGVETTRLGHLLDGLEEGTQSPHVQRVGTRRIDARLDEGELEALVDELGADIPVELMRPSVVEEGRWPLVRATPALLDLVGLLILLGLLLALFLHRTSRLQASSRRAWDAPACCLFGGLALLALGTSWYRELPSPLWLSYAITLAAQWRALELLAQLDARGPRPVLPLRLALVLPPAILLLGLLFALLAMPEHWLNEGAAPSTTGLAGLGLLLLWVPHLVEVALTLREKGGRGRVRAGALSLSTIALVAATLLWAGVMPDLHPDDMPLLLIGAIFPVWLASIVSSLEDPESLRSRVFDGDEGPCIRALIRDAEELLPTSQVWLAVGNGERFQGLRPPPRGVEESGRVLVRTLPESWESALSMLHAEGGIFPRTSDADPDDPLFGVSERTGLAIAIPLGQSSDDLVVYLLADAGQHDAAELPLDMLLERCAEVDPRALRAELFWLSMGPEAEGASTPREPGDPESRDVDVASGALAEQSTSTSVSDGEGAAAAQEAERLRMLLDAYQLQLDTLHPVDDPAVLSEGEWRALRRWIEDDAPLLITGEPGVGKEFVARAIARARFGPGLPVVAYDFSRTPPALIEAELFGEGEVPGLVELAGEGCVILKGSASLDAERLGTLLASLSRCPLRLIFCERYTGPENELEENLPAPILELVGGNRLSIAPLRERPEDLLRYAAHYLNRYAMAYERSVSELSADAAAALCREELPANFHDLQQLIRAAVLRSEEGELRPADLHLPETPPRDEELSPDELKEREACLAALEASSGNKSEAARILGMSRGSLLRRLKKFGIEDGG